MLKTPTYLVRLSACLALDLLPPSMPGLEATCGNPGAPLTLLSTAPLDTTKSTGEAAISR